MPEYVTRRKGSGGSIRGTAELASMPSVHRKFILHCPQWWATETNSFIRRVLRGRGTNPGGHRTHLGTQIRSRPGLPALPTKCHHITLGAALLPPNWKPNAQRRPLVLNAGHSCWNHCPPLLSGLSDWSGHGHL